MAANWQQTHYSRFNTENCHRLPIQGSFKCATRISLEPSRSVSIVPTVSASKPVLPLSPKGLPAQRTVRLAGNVTPDTPAFQEASTQTDQSTDSKEVSFPSAVVAYEINKTEGFWKQVGQRLKRFFQDIGNTFKRLFSHKVDFALDNSLEQYKQKLTTLIKTPEVGQWLKKEATKTKAILKNDVENSLIPDDLKPTYNRMHDVIESLEKSKKLEVAVASGFLNRLEPSFDQDHLITKRSELTPEQIELTNKILEQIKQHRQAKA
jgi:hypothetical protein